MNSTSVLTLVIGLALGALVAALAVWLIMRSRVETMKAEIVADEERQRADVAQLKADTAEARAAIERATAEAERSRSTAARADAEKSGVHAQMAQLQAQVGKAEAERDAALARAAELIADRESLVTQFTAVSAETLERQGRTADAAEQVRYQQAEALLKPMQQTLESLQARLVEVEKERVRISTDLVSQVSTVQLAGDELRKETRALVTALRKPQVRGAWGELQLQRVVEISGMVEHCDFEVQVSADGAQGRLRPDMQVWLSHNKFIFVDAKAPLAAFLDAQESDDEAAHARHMESYVSHIRSHIDALSSKNYWKLSEHSPEFVVLFLPSDALAIEALQRMPDLHEYAAAKDIIVAAPTTLIAMLRAVAYGWKQTQLAANAAEVSRLGQELYDRLSTLGKHMEKLGKSLQGSVRAYNESVGSLEGRVLVTARRFSDLLVTSKPLAELDTVTDAVRPVTAAELIAPANDTDADTESLPERAQLVRQPPEVNELANGDVSTVNALDNVV